MAAPAEPAWAWGSSPAAHYPHRQLVLQVGRLALQAVHAPASLPQVTFQLHGPALVLADLLLEKLRGRREGRQAGACSSLLGLGAASHPDAQQVCMDHQAATGACTWISCLAAAAAAPGLLLLLLQPLACCCCCCSLGCLQTAPAAAAAAPPPLMLGMPSNSRRAPAHAHAAPSAAPAMHQPRVSLGRRGRQPKGMVGGRGGGGGGGWGPQAHGP